MRLALVVPSIAILGLLAACSGGTRVASPAKTVSYHVVSTDDLTQANKQAADYCRPQGAFARLNSVANGVANYECTPVAVQAPPAR